MAERLGCDTKTIDNALHARKRKIITQPEGARAPFQLTALKQVAHKLASLRLPRRAE